MRYFITNMLFQGQNQLVFPSYQYLRSRRDSSHSQPLKFKMSPPVSPLQNWKAFTVGFASSKLDNLGVDLILGEFKLRLTADIKYSVGFGPKSLNDLHKFICLDPCGSLIF